MHHHNQSGDCSTHCIMYKCCVQIKWYCNVVFKNFNFDGFSPYVRQRFVYAWKPLVIAVKPIVYFITAYRYCDEQFCGNFYTCGTSLL
jgi:hypothetical protein